MKRLLSSGGIQGPTIAYIAGHVKPCNVNQQNYDPCKDLNAILHLELDHSLTEAMPCRDRRTMSSE